VAHLSAVSNRVRRRPVSSFNSGQQIGGAPANIVAGDGISFDGSTVEIDHAFANVWLVQQTFTKATVILDTDDTFAVTLVTATP